MLDSLLDKSQWLLCILLMGGVQAALYGIIKKNKIGQHIYALSPESHQKKSHTPSLGGLGIILSIIIGSGIYLKGNSTIVAISILALLFMALGLVDDLLSLMAKKNKGLSAKTKFSFQCLIAAGWLYGLSTWIMPLTVITGVFYVVVIVGTSNATNLTDGVDGLLSSVMILSVLGFCAYFILQGNDIMTAFCGMIILALAVFLIWNWNPAKLFMGDTGSLALGALLAGLSIVIGNPWVLLPLGAVYIMETGSVIVQVLYFKKTQKRVFLMSPLHHHFELLGLSEKQVVGLFILIQGLFTAYFIGTLGS